MSYIRKKDKLRLVSGEMIRRSRLETYFDILKVMEEGEIKPSRIMYKTNLNWIPLQENLSVLISSGFIREERLKYSARYYITDKGQSSLSHYRQSLEELITTQI